MRKICIECNQPFETRTQDLICKDCVKKILNENDSDYHYNMDPIAKPKKKKKPQVVIDANRASELGMSYGEYMASKGATR